MKNFTIKKIAKEPKRSVPLSVIADVIMKIEEHRNDEVLLTGYSPNRFCEFQSKNHIWDSWEMMRDEFPSNFLS